MGFAKSVIKTFARVLLFLPVVFLCLQIVDQNINDSQEDVMTLYGG